MQPTERKTARFVDEALLAQVRAVREKLHRGVAQAADAIAQVEGLLRELGLEIRIWLPVGRRTIRGEGGARELEVFLGYSDEGDGAWGVKLTASDPRAAGARRFARLSACSQSLQVRLLPKVRELARGVVGRARELADLIEQAVEG